MENDIGKIDIDTNLGAKFEKFPIDISKFSSQIEYLVLAGGGVKGFWSAGVLWSLEEAGILKNIKGVAGTSIGAIIGSLYVIGYTPKEIASTMCSIPLNLFIGKPDFTKVMTKGYNSEWDMIKSTLKDLIRSKCGKSNITLLDVYERTKMELNIFAICRETRKTAVLNHKNFPDLPLERAIRMSMALPLILKSVRWKGKHYLDSGCRINYPMHIFPLEKTLGIRPSVRGCSKDVKLEKFNGSGNILDLLSNIKSTFTMIIELMLFIFNCLSEEVEERMLKEKTFFEIQGNSTTSTFDFDISEMKKVAIVQKGKVDTEEFLKQPFSKKLIIE